MKTAFNQFVRFAVVGLASNALGFGWYLLLTWLGVGPKAAMSLLFLLGTLQTFVFNKRWSFQHDGPTRPVLLRYLAVYGFGYLVNLVMLMLLVDHAGLPHAPVQGAMIIVVAMLMFLLQKFWVFNKRAPAPAPELPQN
jgi:putative flippase GtrA